MSCNPKSFANMKLLNICTFNARSIRNKMAELSNFIYSHKIHVLAVSETWLSSLDSDGDITLPGFQEPFRKDRNTKGGGVCIFLSNQLSGKRRSDLEDPDLELLWVEMKLSGHHRSLFVGQARSQGCRKGGYILRGSGGAPQNFFKFKVANTPKFNDFLQLPIGPAKKSRL